MNASDPAGVKLSVIKLFANCRLLAGTMRGNEGPTKVAC
jgi:hypothetical protein